MNLRIKAAILISAIALSVIFTGIATASKPTKKANTVNSSQPTHQAYYILREYKGKLAIFSSEDSLPIHQIDVIVDSLPERDREKLKKGIRAKSPEDALLMAEDYE